MSNHIVFFDGVCNLCNWSVDFILSRDTRGVFQFASLQSEAAQQLLNDHQANTREMRTIVLLKDEILYYRSNAALEIVRDLRYPWPLLYVFKLVPGFLRDAVYRLISRNRYRWFGKRNTCRIPTSEERARFLNDDYQDPEVNNKHQRTNSRL